MKRAWLVILLGIGSIPSAFAQEARDPWEVGGGIHAVGSQRAIGWVADVTRDIGPIAWMAEGTSVTEPLNSTTTTTFARQFPALTEIEVLVDTEERNLTTYTALTGPAYVIGGTQNVYVTCRALTGVVVRSLDANTFSNVAAKTGCGIAFAIERQLGIRLNVNYLYLGGGGGEHLPNFGAGFFVRF